MASVSDKTYSVDDVRRGYARAYEPWDTYEDDFLLRSYERGLTAEQISVILGRTFGAIRSRLEQLGIELPSGPGPSQADRERRGTRLLRVRGSA
jgi:hypothetical protein